MSARNSYLSAFEELDDSLKAVEGITPEQIRTIKRTITTRMELGTIPRSLFIRNAARARERLSEAVRETLSEPEYRILMTRLFSDPSPQNEQLTALLAAYREYLRASESSDSDSE